ncbi:MAG: recombinase family protein [Acidobacteriales bacterium]|nr:recombinase family protein [Terriglobales bacterium]
MGRSTTIKSLNGREERQSARAQIAVGYCRRSTDRQEQSIPDQKKAVEHFAAEQGLVILRFYVDDAISGTSVAGRKAFQQLIADAQREGCDFSYVVVYDVKRFGRVDNDEAGYYRHILKSNGVEVLYASENFSGDYTDDLLRPVKQWQARQESKDLSKVTIRGLMSKQPSGAWLGGVPPHGYDLRYENDRGEFLFTLRHMSDGTKQMMDEKGKVFRTLIRGESLNICKRDRAKLILGDPDRVGVVRKIFKMYTQEGKGLTAVSDWLNRNKVPTPRGPAWSHIYCGQWADSTVRAILVNPIYAGDMVWNRRTDARFHKISNGHAVERKQVHGARLEPNGKADWMIVPDAHPALIPRRTFEQAQRIREGKPTSEKQRGKERVVGGWNGARSRFVLSGLIRCGLCGHRYQGLTRTKPKARKDGTHCKNHYYACGGYISRGNSVCQYRPLRKDDIEHAVINAVLDFYKRYDGADGETLLFEMVQKHLGVEAQDLASARKRVVHDRKRIESSIANVLDNITTNNRDLAERRLSELRRERDELQVRADELERLRVQQHEVQSLVHEVRRFLNSLEFTLKHGLPEERKIALRQCVQEVGSNAQAHQIIIRQLPEEASPTEILKC